MIKVKLDKTVTGTTKNFFLLNTAPLSSSDHMSYDRLCKTVETLRQLGIFVQRNDHTDL